MTGRVKHYFAGGNTARGFYSLYEDCLTGINKVYFLLDGSGVASVSIMKDIGTKWAEKGYDIEYLHTAAKPSSLDGVIIRDLKVGIIDGMIPLIMEAELPGIEKVYLNLLAVADSEKISDKSIVIAELNEQMNEAYTAAFRTFAEALEIHDDWEKVYIGRMDFEKANELTEQLIATLIADRTVDKQAHVQHRFLGAATPKGAVDFVPNLTEDVRHRYLLKGRPGSGKSTMLKKLADKAKESGFDVEMYHCGFDPYSIDMVIVRELDFAIFDSTAPHEYFPTREGDTIIDLYGSIIKDGTDELYAEDIAMYATSYKEKMQIATSYLRDVKQTREEIEEIYLAAMDFSIVAKCKGKIDKEIDEIL